MKMKPRDAWISEDEAARRLGVPIVLLRMMTDMPESEFFEGLDRVSARRELLVHLSALPLPLEAKTMAKTVGRLAEYLAETITEAPPEEDRTKMHDAAQRMCVAGAVLLTEGEIGPVNLYDVLRLVGQLMVDFATVRSN